MVGVESVTDYQWEMEMTISKGSYYGEYASRVKIEELTAVALGLGSFGFQLNCRPARSYIWTS